MPIDDDVVDDDSSSNYDDVSMSSVPIVPLLLPQPVLPLNADDTSFNSEGSTTDDNFTFDDNDSNTLTPAHIAPPLANAPAELPLDFVPAMILVMFLLLQSLLLMMLMMFSLTMLLLILMMFFLMMLMFKQR